jgi:CHAT domain-containing protein/tetratricopeptide (TPR) repeat protein
MKNEDLSDKAKQLFEQGLNLNQQNRLKEAIRKYKASKTLYEQLELEDQAASVREAMAQAYGTYRMVKAKQLFDQANDLAKQGKEREAIRKYIAAKTICKKIGDLEGIAANEYNIGSSWQNLFKPARALIHYKTAKSNYLKLAGGPKVAYILADLEKRIGIVMRSCGRPSEALVHFGNAEKIFASLRGFPERIASCNVDIGFTIITFGLIDKYEEALSRYKFAKSILEKIDLQERAAGVEIKIGNALEALDRYEQALVNYRNAKTVFKALNKEEGLAQANTNIGNALSKLGESSEALKYYEDALTSYKKLQVDKETEEAMAGVGMNEGNALQDLGRYEEALLHYEPAKQFFEKADPLAQSLAMVEMDIGNTLNLMGKHKESLAHYEVAKRIFEKLHAQELATDIDINLGQTFRNLKRWREAWQKFEKVISISSAFGFLSLKSKAYRGIAGCYLDAGKPKTALICLKKSFDLMEQVRIGVRSPELQRSLRKQYIDVSDEICSVHLVLLDLKDGAEHLGEALNAIELAKCSTMAEFLEAGGAGVSCPEMAQLVVKEDRLLNLAKQNFSKLRQLTKLRSSNEITRAEFSNRSTAWDKEYSAVQKEIEGLRSDMLVNCADVGSTPIPRNYNVLNRTLEIFPKNEKWCILEFAISSSSDKLIVFLIDQNGSIQFRRHYVSIAKVKDYALKCRGVVNCIRDAMGGRKIADQRLRKLSESLYSTLIPEEIQATIKEKDMEHLIVIPHEILHWVPFEVIYDGKDYWGTKYALSMAFSLDIARLCVEKRIKNSLKFGERPLFLLIRNPLLDLKGADCEVDDVCSLIETKKIPYEILNHQQATQNAFVDNVNSRPFNLVLFAGHALFLGKNPSLSSLYLHTSGECPACSGTAKKHTSEFLNAKEIIHSIKFKNTPIVYLSACESGAAEVELGDEVFGLLRALMYAGATSLIASKWPVRDEVGRVFAEEFCSQLLKNAGTSVSVALRNARQKLFADERYDFTDWSVFSLHGDPFRKIA